LKSEFSWLQSLTSKILDPIGASGFLFTSGVSITLSYRNRLVKLEKDENYSFSQVKYEFLFRAAFIVILGLIYNIFAAIMFMDPSQITTLAGIDSYFLLINCIT